MCDLFSLLFIVARVFLKLSYSFFVNRMSVGQYSCDGLEASTCVSHRHHIGRWWKSRWCDIAFEHATIVIFIVLDVLIMVGFSQRPSLIGFLLLRISHCIVSILS